MRTAHATFPEGVAVKLQFDPNQPYQLDTVAAVTNLFDGQPQGAPEYSVINVEDIGGLFAGQTPPSWGLATTCYFSKRSFAPTPARCRRATIST